jgi:type VI protein secretion system component VasF
MLNEFDNSSASMFPAQADGPTVVRRQASEAVRNGQKAVALLRPILSRMGGWQAEAIKLDTMLKRIRLSGRRDETVEQQVRALLDIVTTEREQFEASLTSQPEKVVAHSRVRDARFCLQSIADRLRASLQ